MKIHNLRIVVAVAGFAIATSAWAFHGPWYGWGHKLKIRLDGSATKSIWVAGTAADGLPAPTLNSCIQLSNAQKGWREVSYVLANGSFVKVLAFSDSYCTHLRRERSMKVPGADGLDFVYLPLY